MDIPNEDEYDFIMYIQIDEIRMLYDHICYSIKMWPGSPARPAEEQEYLVQLKNRLFAMLADYTFSNMDI
tara:strand:+ start:350 stop:559 length:210 start_codon:yes stop_codon:yes gene_type:complete